MAKTVMGSYSAGDVMEHMRGQGGPGPQTPRPQAPAQNPNPYQPPTQVANPGPAGGANPYQSGGGPQAPTQVPNPYQSGGGPQAQNPYQSGGGPQAPNPYQSGGGPQAPTQVPNPYQGGGGPQAPTQVPNPYQGGGGPQGQNPYPSGPQGQAPYQGPSAVGPQARTQVPNHPPGPQGGNPYPAGPPQPQGAPFTPASAAPTLFVPGGGAVPQGPGPGPQGGPRQMQPTPSPYAPQAGAFQAAPQPQGYQPPQQQGYQPPQQQGYQPPQPIAPLPPSFGSPYGVPQATARAGRPIEPWRDSLRLMMLLWGGALLVFFVVPLMIEPLAFQWNLIIDAPGKLKVPPLILVSVGILSVLFALVPTSPAPRGLIAGILGLAGLFLVKFLDSVPHWRLLLPLVGMPVLVAGLFLRQEYRESIAPRILVTVGALAVLSLLLLPVDGNLPIVGLFKAAIDTPGTAKVEALLDVFFFVIVVLTLLAWLPAPASAGAKVFAWILILHGAIDAVAKIALGAIDGGLTVAQPTRLLDWVPDTAYFVLIGYGFATLIGKKLE